MKKVMIVLTLLGLSIYYSCDIDYNNPYDRACPEEIWTPFYLKATELDEGILLEWELTEQHFDGYWIEKSIDSIHWSFVNAKLLIPSLKQYLDTNKLFNSDLLYRIHAVADLNSSGYRYTDIINIDGNTPVDPDVDPVLKTIVSQPGPDDGIDTHIASSGRYMDVNYGDRDNLRVAAWTDNMYSSPNDDARALINFQVLTELSSSQIELAVLTLYSANHVKWDNGGQFGNNASAIYIVTENWDENTVTWNTQPAYSLEHSVIIPKNNQYDSIKVDITDLTKNMLQYNKGFIIKQLDENPYSSMVFSSSDFSDEKKRPKLVVKYWD